jgi:hypothetical protein
MEGVRATGANRWQFYRFGVIPQIIPVFISQCLYYLESNVRSATIIGALGAGGIGLMLVETMNTQRDWENTLYLIVLTIFPGHGNGRPFGQASQAPDPRQSAQPEPVNIKSQTALRGFS